MYYPMEIIIDLPIGFPINNIISLLPDVRLFSVKSVLLQRVISRRIIAGDSGSLDEMIMSAFMTSKSSLVVAFCSNPTRFEFLMLPWRSVNFVCRQTDK